MNASEIYAIDPERYGWRVLPNGNYVKLGDRVKLGNNVTLGEDVTLGDNVKLGDHVACLVTPPQILGRRFVCYPISPGVIGIGCTGKSLAEWEVDGATLANKHNIPCDEVAEYEQYVRIIAEWMDSHRDLFTNKGKP